MQRALVESFEVMLPFISLSDASKLCSNVLLLTIRRNVCEFFTIKIGYFKTKNKNIKPGWYRITSSDTLETYSIKEREK